MEIYNLWRQGFVVHGEYRDTDTKTHFQGENKKSPSPAWVDAGHCGVKEQKRLFQVCQPQEKVKH